jgi:hypothetical protein
MRMLRKDFQIIYECMHEIREMRDWTRHTDTPQQKIYYRQEKGQKTLTLYLEGLIKAPIINVVSIFAEVQLLKEWVPLTKVSDLIGEVSHLRKAIYFKYGLSWPFTSREIFLQGCGLVMKEERACCMALSSVQGSSWLGYPTVRDKKTGRN